MVGEAGGERHDRERRVGREGSRYDRAVTDEQPPDRVGLAVGVDDRARRVAAHAAASLDVRGHQAGPENLLGPGRLERVAAELQGVIEALELGSLEVAGEGVVVARARVGVREDGAVVVVVDHHEQAGPMAIAPQRLDQGLSPHRSVLVLEVDGKADRVLHGDRLHHEPAVLVAAVLRAVRGDRIDDVGVLALLEAAEHQARRMEAEVASDQRILDPRARQKARGVERPGGQDDRAADRRQISHPGSWAWT